MPQPSPPPACPSDAELVELVEGRLDGQALGRLKAHVGGCSACATFLAGVGLDGDRRAPSGRADSGIARAVLEETRLGSGPVSGRARGGVLGRGASVGRYLVLSLIGRGGMGEVYAAYDPELDRRVALKLLHTARSAEQARRRLTREARALGKLSHPNVVQVYDVGEHEGDVFVAMELVEGESLDAWCKGEPRPPWPEVLAAYLDAAGGLAAAHAKGIVHRDVKPANILRGKDGRVCVADFGLAAGQPVGALPPGPQGPAAAPAPDGDLAGDTHPGQASPLAETMPAHSDSDGRRDDPLTATGALLGTPLYMAPEQFEGAGVGPASDQHSLCTALYQGLYGMLPFQTAPGPAQLLQLVVRKTEGPPPSPPPGSPVPAAIHRALVRGLAPRPQDRYPSMEALVEALREARQPPRRTRLRAAAIGGVVALAALAAVRSGVLANPCAHPERQLAGAWDEEVRGRVRAAFAGTGRSYAEDTAGRVAAILDRYTASWASMRGEVCEASRSGGQRRELVGLRDECLDRRLGEIRALTGLFAERPDVQILDKAVQAASGLPPVQVCADAEALSARVRPPEDPELQRRVAALRPRVDRLQALLEAGKYREGLPLGEAIQAEPGAMAHAPLRAQIQYLMGALRAETGDEEAAKALLRDAAVSAAEGRDDVTATLAWTRLLFVVGERQQRLEEAALLRSLAPVVVRTHDDHTLAAWLSAEGLTLFRAGKHAEAIARHERALAILETAGRADPALASTCNNLGNAYAALGDTARARVMLERGLSVWEKALGPEHPAIAAPLNNLGNMEMSVGEYAPARAKFERALAIWEKTRGPGHAFVGYASNNLGEVLYHLGDDPAAAAYFERARALFEKTLDPTHPSVAAPLTGLGRCKTRLGQLDEARPLLTRALQIREKALGPAHPEVAEPLLGLAELSLARHEPAEAVTLLERALALHDADIEPTVQITLADALWPSAADRPRARDLVEQALRRYEHLGHRPGQDRAGRWLSEHAR